MTRSPAYLNFDNNLIRIVKQYTNFSKLFQQIISRDQNPEMNEVEIPYYHLDMKWMKLGGNKWMVCLN